jgi:hypothetical protein
LRLCRKGQWWCGCSAIMPSCEIRRAHADENGPGDCFAGSARRLDRSGKPGPFHRFTISKSGRDSLP